uniref:Uncharacterized protein n=1 Tax=Arundo donax TaxID=35708 RepID=A0A0A9DGN3_ARUDO
MFKAALWAVWCMGPDNISAKLDFLKTTFGCSEAEMALVVSKAPQILRISEGKLSRTVKYLTVELGLKPQYIAYRPALLSYSMQRRLMPRHYVIKVLKAKGLVKEDIDFYNVVCSTEKRFKVKFLDRYKESVPGLADSYVTACSGQMPHEIQL